VSSRKKPKRSASVNGKASLPTNGIILTAPVKARSVSSSSPRQQRKAFLLTLAAVLFALSGIIMVTAVRTDIGSLLPWATPPPAPYVDGIPCQTDGVRPFHIQAHLTILDNGQPVTIPANVGIVTRPAKGGNGSAVMTVCQYWLNTRDDTGVINAEAPIERTFNLGQFFDIWHQPLTSTNVAGHLGTVTTFVDQKPYIGDPRAIDLTDHLNVTLEVGQAVPPPANYNFGS